MTNKPGLDIIERLRERIFEHWQEVRSTHEDVADDLLCVVHEEEERTDVTTTLTLTIVPRETFVAASRANGETFEENFGYLLKPAHEFEPKLPSGHGLWVVLHLRDGQSAFMRLVYQHLWIKGGQA